ncbi:PREDICTED: uncharacterized protein LOC108766779 [Trachymyrmex cornetzi]|uniref:uncharacterized protein LOC108766779 n=1 Tax=Trachymyrmex cornetzi TaxID=471704 RepID=UPI00084F40DA|nr:PREDICTED: uncharacterized protein LOC108766779 [Trachymyrmex cornetzi]XP_018371782.1 PREDICTED: uncharacterized protein LOC108766779 [Trachymyrmex cornetzi]
MCTCSPNSNNREEYHTALSEFEIPEDRHTSTQYYEEEFAPPYYSTPISPQISAPISPQISAPISAPISTPRRIPSYQRMPRPHVRSALRRGFMTGVAIVPRRIDFDAVSHVEEIDDEETARERLQRLQTPVTRPPIIPETGAPATYRLRRTRATQYPFIPERTQYVPRMVRITPCGKCLRI